MFHTECLSYRCRQVLVYATQLVSINALFSSLYRRLSNKYYIRIFRLFKELTSTVKRRSSHPTEKVYVKSEISSVKWPANFNFCSRENVLRANNQSTKIKRKNTALTV